MFGRRVDAAPARRGRLQRSGARCGGATASGSPSGSRRASRASPTPAEDRDAFAVRCSARQRERQLGTGYGFGIFVDGNFAGEINLNVRAAGPVPERLRRLLDRRGAGRQRLHARGAGRACCRFAFEELHLHRLQIAIIPRNQASRRVVEKLEIREEGIAARYLEINGAWEDHVRYAITPRSGTSAATSCVAEWT